MSHQNLHHGASALQVNPLVSNGLLPMETHGSLPGLPHAYPSSASLCKRVAYLVPRMLGVVESLTPRLPQIAF